MISGPINFTRYGSDLRRIELDHYTPTPRRARIMKIHLVKIAGQEKPRLVKAHTRMGAEKFVRDSIKPAVTASVPSQEQLVAALKDGVEIEDATNSPQTSVPEPSQASTEETQP
jgi:hypothetical protein